MDTIETNVCGVCLLPKAILACGHCNKRVCKKHAVRVDVDRFTYLDSPPEIFKQNAFCEDCYDSEFLPELAIFEELQNKAKEVGIWSKSYRGRIPILKKSQEWIEYKGFQDRKELIYRLGFRAAELGFNAVIQVEVKSEKIRDHAYQKMIWHAKGLPAEVDMEKVSREEEREVFWRELFHR